MEIDIRELRNDIEMNRQERMKFVALWADFVRIHEDREWSQQQNVLINSMFQNSKNYPLTKEQYLEIKAVSNESQPFLLKKESVEIPKKIKPVIMKEIKIDLKELEEDKKKNFEERLKFIDMWVDYIKKHPDQKWSAEQKVLIDKAK